MPYYQERLKRKTLQIRHFADKKINWRGKNHEERVEKFYSHGSEKRALEAEGFLSFGYWDEDTENYLESAENLVEYVIREAKIEKGGTILNVACGNGTESLKFFHTFNPKKMICIDITAAHIDTARAKICGTEFGSKITFEKRNAVNTGFPDSTFNHIVGIEGPSHFNTRKNFFNESYRLLRDGGEIVLTDIVVSLENAQKYFFLPALTRFIARRWHMPEENLVSAEMYKTQLIEAGFVDVHVETIGNRVFRQFAKNNCRFGSILKAIRIRGFFIGMGLTIISWFLGFGYKTGVIDYIFVKAKKGACRHE